MNYLKAIEDEVLAWPNVSAHLHRFGGKEFRFGRAEIGHLHTDGTLDIPFPRAIRDALIKDGQAGEHRWVPDSGWTTFRAHSRADVSHAVALLRISYLRYVLKTTAGPRDFLKQESDAMRLSPQVTILLERVVPHSSCE